MIRLFARRYKAQLAIIPLTAIIWASPSTASTSADYETAPATADLQSTDTADASPPASSPSPIAIVSYAAPNAYQSLPSVATTTTAFVADDISFPNSPSSVKYPTDEYGPVSHQQVSIAPDRLGHIPREYATHRSFGQQAGAIKTELILLTAYVGAQSIPKLFRETQSFRFKDEGWFGLNTSNVGVDKLTHAMNTYLIAELLHYRIHKNTGGSQGDAVTAAVIAAGAMAINELSDAIEPNGGYSMQDIAMNIAGASFSVLRNTVPGLKEKLSFKVEVVPNKHIYSRQGKKHFEQQRYMMSLKGAGFEGLRNTPFRYLDAQLGYYASDFLLSDRAAGITPKRHLFVGVGLNVGEIFFANSRSRVGRAAHNVLDYVQLPYTSLRYDTTGRIGN